MNSEEALNLMASDTVDDEISEELDQPQTASNVSDSIESSENVILVEKPVN